MSPESGLPNSKSIFEERPDLNRLKSYDVVVKAPASCFLVGEYAVMHGKPGIVIPIPVYLYLGMKLTESKGLELSKSSCSGSPKSDYRYPSGEPCIVEPDNTLTKNIFKAIKEHFITPCNIEKGIVIETCSEIPTGCGLGSSGAFAAATSVAAHFLVYDKSFIKIQEKWRGIKFQQLLSDNIFKSVFQLAWKLEGLIQGKSSGCAPFTALVGSSDELPLVYSILDIDNCSIYARKLSDLVNPRERDILRRIFWEDAGFALVFSGEDRKQGSDEINHRATRIADRFKGELEFLKNHLVLEKSNVGIPSELSQLCDLTEAQKNVDSNLWDIFSFIFIGSLISLVKESPASIDAGIKDVMRVINLAQSLFSFLEVSTDSIDIFVLDCKRHDTACKISGWGQGGDVLLFGEKDNIKTCIKKLVPGDKGLRLHYASWGEDKLSVHVVDGAKIIWNKKYKQKPPTSTLKEKADFAIITAIPEEFEAVQAVFHLKSRVKKDGHNYFVGRVPFKSNPDKKRFVVCARPQEKGNPESQDLTDQILHDWNPSYIFLVGTAGGVEGREKVKLGDVVVSNSVVFDSKKETTTQTKIYPVGNKTPSSDILEAVKNIGDSHVKWWKTIKHIPNDHPKAIVGQFISGATLRGNPNSPEIHELLNQLPYAIAVEMEAAGVAHTLYKKETVFHTQYAVVKGITDWVNIEPEPKKNQDTRDDFRVPASQAAAALAYAIIQEINLETRMLESGQV